MAESSTRKVGRICLNKDRISVLPRNIQETILCSLPIRDAVRTSILSRSWRHCWTTVPNLVFDQYIPSIKWDDYSECSECHGPELSSLEYVSVINKVLLLHNGPVLKFSLKIPYFCDSKVIHNFIDQWIPLFSRKCIKQLTLEGCSREKFTAHNFSSLDLTHLRLESVWFPYTPAFGGLTYLRSIELIQVAAPERSIFDCPVLENLTLKFCIRLFPINFRAPNLKFLHQKSFEITSEYSLARFENLTEFSFRLVILDPDILTETSNVVKVFGGLHKIEKISIEDFFIEYLAAGGSPKRFSNPLSCVKTLSFSGINSTCLSEVSCLLCLIRSAPNLCKLHISAKPYSEEEDLEDYCEEDNEDCTLNHLEIITFSHFNGLKAEFELVKFLLAHSPLLKTMFIHRNHKMKKDVAIEILEEMLEFSRASSRAQIKSLKLPFIG